MIRTVKKRTFVLEGSQTSVTIEDEFWREVKRIANAEGLSVGALVKIARGNYAGKTTASALRLLVLDRALRH